MVWTLKWMAACKLQENEARKKTGDSVPILANIYTALSTGKFIITSREHQEYALFAGRIQAQRSRPITVCDRTLRTPYQSTGIPYWSPFVRTQNTKSGLASVKLGLVASRGADFESWQQNHRSSGIGACQPVIPENGPKLHCIGFNSAPGSHTLLLGTFKPWVGNRCPPVQ